MPLRVERSSDLRPIARRLDVIAVKPVELGVQVLGQQAFPRAQLHGVRQRLRPGASSCSAGVALGGELRLELFRQPPQQLLVGRRVQPAHAGELRRLFQQAAQHAAAGRIEQQRRRC